MKNKATRSKETCKRTKESTVHLRNWLLDAQAKNQIERGHGIRQMINRENNVRVWYLIQRTVKDPGIPAVLKVQTVKNGRKSTYTKQEDIKEAIQKQSEYCFTLTHRAPIMKHTLTVKLGCVVDKEVAKATIEGTYDIPTDLDGATKLILEDIRRTETKIRNKEGQETVIAPEDFIWSWKWVGEFTTSSPSGIHYSQYKASAKCKLSRNNTCPPTHYHYAERRLP